MTGYQHNKYLEPVSTWKGFIHPPSAYIHQALPKVTPGTIHHSNLLTFSCLLLLEFLCVSPQDNTLHWNTLLWQYLLHTNREPQPVCAVLSHLCHENLLLHHTITVSLKTVTVHPPFVARALSTMDHKSLATVAQRAILSALKYHFSSTERGAGPRALDRQTKDTISADIRKNLPLADFAEDRDKAYLEIVCDAALPVAESYEINKRWFYTAVQGLTSMELVPSLYEDAAVPLRLSTVDGNKDDGKAAGSKGQKTDHK